MIKKFVLFILIINMILLFAACSSDKAAAETAATGQAAAAETAATEQAASMDKTAESPDGTAPDNGVIAPGSSDMMPDISSTVPDIEGAVTDIGSTAPDGKETLPDAIIKTDAAYEAYDSDIFEADYDGDGLIEKFYVFTDKSARKEADIGCSADIWFEDENGVIRAAEWQCIQPDTYGILELAGKYYFRYDLAFATESQTILLSVKNRNSIESYNCRGFAEFGDNTGDFTVTNSTYDMVYLKSDDLTCGHTWKRYFYYADEKGFHEYGARKITRKEFLRYPGADGILDRIGKKYRIEGVTLSFGFLKRCNGLLHININSETKDDITHYYMTYKIATDGTLSEVEAGEGYYASAADTDLAVYK